METSYEIVLTSPGTSFKIVLSSPVTFDEGTEFLTSPGTSFKIVLSSPVTFDEGTAAIRCFDVPTKTDCRGHDFLKAAKH